MRQKVWSGIFLGIEVHCPGTLFGVGSGSVWVRVTLMRPSSCCELNGNGNGSVQIRVRVRAAYIIRKLQRK